MSMDQELKPQRLAVVLHTITGLIAGYLSLYFSRFWYALGPAILLMLISGFITQKTFGKGKDKKWWMGNGAVIYLLVWIMAWIVLFNIVPLPVNIV